MNRKYIIVPPPPPLSPYEDELLWKLGLNPTVMMELAIHLYPDYVYHESYYYDTCYHSLSSLLEEWSTSMSVCDSRIATFDQNSDSVIAILIGYSKYFAPFIEMSNWNQGPDSRLIVSIRPHGRQLAIETDIY